MAEHDDGTLSGRGRRVHRALTTATGFVSARELHGTLLRAGTPMGLATVYRQLHTLVECGLTETVRTSNGELFRAMSSPAQPHVHLVCDGCGWADEVDAAVGEVATSVTHLLSAIDARGITAARPSVEVHGVCAECR